MKRDKITKRFSQKFRSGKFYPKGRDLYSEQHAVKYMEGEFANMSPPVMVKVQTKKLPQNDYFLVRFSRKLDNDTLMALMMQLPLGSLERH